MARGMMCGLVLLAGLALGAPPPLVLVSPLDGGWAGTRSSFVVRLDGGAPYGTRFNRVEFRVLDGAGVTVASTGTSVSPSDDDTSRTLSAVLDAGPYGWTARTVDSSGDASVWAPPEPFRWDGVLPPAPGFVTIDDLDAGGVRFSYGPVLDAESGLLEYHPAISFEGGDGGIDFSNSMLESRQLTGSAWLGPGTWRLGVHAHDVAGNVGAAVETPLFVIQPSAELAGMTPALPQLFFMDGGAIPSPAILNSTTFRARWTSPFDGGVFVVGRRALAGNLLAVIANRSAASVLLDHSDDGLFEVQVAHALDGRLSGWSSAVRYQIDQSRPFSPTLTATVDGGQVSLRWNGVNDRGTPASGVALHALSRTRPDASVLVASFDAGVAQYLVNDQPGAGASTYTVRVIDVAGNVATASAGVFIGAPPVLEAPLVGPPFSRGPVTVSWDAGGVAATFEVSREDRLGLATVVTSATPTESFVDPAPEGAWRYRVRARVNGLDGPASAPSAEVVVDQTGPTATVDATRRSTNVVEVRWTASDDLAGLDTLTLERELGGTVTSVGAVTASPVSDTPPDGTWRYRLVAVDRAGNGTTTPFTSPVQVPASVIRVEAPELPPLECYRDARVALATSGEPPVSWALVSGPEGVVVDPVTGALTWTPRNADVGAQVARVRVSGAGSADERDVVLEVTCQPRALKVGCDAAPVLGPLFIAWWLLARRRRGAA
ncbi:MAG: hypothetical protein JNJ54_34245 [Myxococcaceae bacterium]|nr:hypothetical protein [Myxococcaceae bacterium]